MIGVYFLHYKENGINDIIKIGKSTDIIRRAQEIQGASPVNLNLIGYIPTENEAEAYKLEQELHRKFNENRQHGEWFLNPNLYSLPNIKIFIKEGEKIEEPPDIEDLEVKQLILTQNIEKLQQTYNIELRNFDKLNNELKILKLEIDVAKIELKTLKHEIEDLTNIKAWLRFAKMQTKVWELLEDHAEYCQPLLEEIGASA